MKGTRRSIDMGHTTTEIQPYDDCYAAFLIGGNICLLAALSVGIIHGFTQIATSSDGSGVALLLLLSCGVYLVNKGLDSRHRLRNNLTV